MRPGFNPWIRKISWRKEGMATHSIILVWEIPQTEETGGLQSMGSKEMDTTERLTQTHTCARIRSHTHISISLLLTDEILFHCMNMPQLLLHSTKWVDIWAVSVLVTMNNTAINIHVQLLFERVFISLGRIPRNGIAKSYDTFLFDFLRNYQAVFQSWCTIFRITMSHVGEFPFFLIPINICRTRSFLS